MNADFWKGRQVLLTGHTGFKGSWMALVLTKLGAQVHGLSLAPETEPSLHRLLSATHFATEQLVDIRDRVAVNAAVKHTRCDLVIHMAAQALVRHSFATPYETFDTNIMGSLAVLDAVAEHCPQAPVMVITSDKVYRNNDSGMAFAEDAPLGGDDPYSASKAACDIVVHAFARARTLTLVTARGGNVVGGGDFAEDRLLPDIVRALVTGQPLQLRHPHATRPWQHVLDAVAGYLRYAEQLSTCPNETPPALNFGPLPGETLTVEETMRAFTEAYGAACPYAVVPHSLPEKQRLALDTTQTATVLGMRNLLSQREAIQWAANWYRGHHEGRDAQALTLEQIARYQALRMA